MNYYIQATFLILYFSTTCLFSQAVKKNNNALLPRNCYIKYIYNFPYKASTVYYSDHFPDLEIRKHENSEIIFPLFDVIFKENYPVYNPNFWGNVEDLVQNGPPDLIDTNGILLYMHAGWDTGFSISINNQIIPQPYYTPPDFHDISGLFFFETWYIDPDKGFFNKHVIAYFPIREYWNEYLLQAGQAERLRRLVLMVYTGLPESKRNKSISKNKYKGYNLLYSGIEYEMGLYNRPYNKYLYRDNSKAEISDQEFNEWQYHTFDFYKHFDADRFLKVITQHALTGKVTAVEPANHAKVLTREDIIARIRDDIYFDTEDDGDHIMVPPASIRYDNLNSIVFNEDWYFDPVSLNIYKIINSITIVRTDYQYDDYTGDFMRAIKTPVLTVIY
ncbi:MAG: hypothetical protein AMS27_15615 [Bacteroides sp. SM23_62_1]|nr:MAG: hypothetical protein AMS27_15615 [Bacteroides sp. SM23_62_1]